MGNERYNQAAIMPLNLYRRHFRTPGKCTAGYEPDFRNYETDELRRGWKKCHCPIYAAVKDVNYFVASATTIFPSCIHRRAW